MPKDDIELYDKYGQETRPNEININPLKKGRRILVFLADFFINLIMAMLLMNIAVMPITKAAGHYKDYSTEMYDRQLDIADILRGNGLLYYEDVNDKAYLENSEYYTATKFIEYYVTGEGEEYDIFKTYYIDIREDTATYLNIYSDSIYFEVVDDSPKLYDEYIELLSPLYTVGDSPSNAGEELYDDIIEDFFYLAFDDMVEDIAINDLSYNGMSYNKIDERMEYLVGQIDTLVVIATYVTYFITTLVCYLVIPLCNKHGKTIAMLIMHAERVGTNNLYLVRKGEVAINSIYSLISNLAFIMFIGWPTVNFNYLFGLGGGQFVILTAISLIILLISLIVLLFSKFNQSLFDKLSRSVLISTDSLDEIYRAEGYKL
ncbi:MAG: RDD family protein [Coprobacillus sp.]|nr:RDD family protein [Coprobacillus sp.]